MKKVTEFFLYYFLRFVLWFRYRIVFKGLKNLNKDTLPKSGGILFLPNHPAVFVDPLSVALGALKKYSIRPMVVEYMYYLPVVNWIMKFLDAIPVPNFTTSSNSLKKKKIEKVMQTVIADLKKGQNFLIYPAGKVKLTGKEAIGGASGVYQILHEAPETNVVLVRVKGLWGSSFSSYMSGKARPLFSTLMEGFKVCLKNLIFFTPRREVIIEFVPAPADFPYKASKMELNHYLEAWYNKPDGLTPQAGDAPGDSLMLVSYSMWGEKYLEPPKDKLVEDNLIDLAAIPDDVKRKVLKKLSELSDRDVSSITPDLNIAGDLGLDSLDIAELSAFLHDQFDVRGVPVNQLTTVAKLMAIGSRQVICKEEEETETDTSLWRQKVKREKLNMAPGKTIPEIFLNNSERYSGNVACGDMRSGIMTYKQFRMRVLLLADKIRGMPGEYIGILLPASVAANLLAIATQLAGKIPLMINWTVGPRHLESVVAISGVQTVISSWAFLDKLENVELDGIEDKLIMLEDVKRDLSLWDKLKAASLTRKSTKTILKKLELDKKEETDTAVLLFTSGTENLPKGVPLSHKNIISNLSSVASIVDVYSDDVLFGILPPFHVFGFSISCLFGILLGMKVASSPDPTDGSRLAVEMEKWGVTIVCGAPTFLRGILKSATPEQLHTMRLCVTGAEKAPPELLKSLEELGKPDSLIEGYGITECSPVLTFNPVGGLHRGVGQAIPGVELCIVHPETHESVPLGTPGLILARGPNIFSGYLNKDMTSPFVEHEGKAWYKTGDLGSLDREGYLTISGRQKRFIKIGGEMISLASIEDALSKKGMEQQNLTAQEGPNLAVCAKEIAGDKPKIFLFSRYLTNLDEVNSSLKESGFSNLVKVSSVIQLEEIPIMGSGKVNYRALEAEYLK